MIDPIERADVFDNAIEVWLEAACREWSFPISMSEQLLSIQQRLPIGTRESIGQGILEGEVVTEGHRFRLRSLDRKKGPYAWFSRYESVRRPGPNWEYFVQVAEYLRLRSIVPASNRINFEDSLMDITVWDKKHLLLCCEVKERAAQLSSLLEGLERHGAGVDMSLPDRHTDDLRKAKYIVGMKPKYLSLVAIGERLEFAVSYVSEVAFRLIPATIDWADQ